MVFKPWHEQRAPRHLLDEAEEDLSTPQPVPDIAVDDVESLMTFQGTLVVLPDTLKPLEDALKKTLKDHTTLATFTISKKFIKHIDPDEYDEDGQLYSTETSTYEHIVSVTCKAVKFNDNLATLTIKNFDNLDKINYHLIATELLKYTDNAQLVTLTPGTIPFDQLCCTLGKDSWETGFQPLVPPFVITGISASLVSKAKLAKRDVTTLVLQSEGVPGFEKVNEYSVQQVGKLFQQKFQLGDKFVDTLTTILHSGKSVNNFGLYL